MRSSVSASSGELAVNPSIERDEHHVGLGGRRRAGEQLADRIAEPQRVADQLAADRVRDARQSGDALLERQREQLVPRDRDLVLDEPVDAQTPVGRVDLRHDERRVDAVELRVGRDHGRESGDAEFGRSRDRRRGRRRRGELQGVADDGDRLRCPRARTTSRPRRARRPRRCPPPTGGRSAARRPVPEVRPQQVRPPGFAMWRRRDVRGPAGAP